MGGFCAAVIVDDVPDVQDRTERLWEELHDLMSDDKKRQGMSEACEQVARPNAAAEIATRLLELTKEKHETRMSKSETNSNTQ
jgi:UDP-N-acetylglucosamine:LPS N-acetylglucosamine transferase